MSADVEKKPFAVTDEASAEWVLEKLEENAKARALIDEQYQRMIARHEAWRADALKELDEDDVYAITEAIYGHLDEIREVNKKAGHIVSMLDWAA